VLVVPEWRQRLADAGLSDLTILLERPLEAGAIGGRWEALTKPDLRGRERWRWEVKSATDAVLFVKRYQGASLGEQVDRMRRQSVGHSRAWWEFQQSAELSRQSVPVVRAVGVVEEMCAAFEVRSAVLFERVPGDAFDRVWPRLCAEQAPLTHGRARHDLARRLARFVSAFHQTGVYHRDLYLCHIFADLCPEPGRPPRFTLIDLARTHRPRLRRTRWLIKDLAQLDASGRQVGATRGDRWRFLLAYLGLEAGAPRMRWYARRIVRKSDHILRRIARKGGGFPTELRAVARGANR
jgi:hypothetical protein